MGLLRRLTGGSSTFRRGPGFDLADYARERGFEMVGDERPNGLLAATGLDPKLRFNVLRRRLDNGRGLLLAHVLEPFHIGSTDTRYRPWTIAALQLPEAVGTLLRVNVRRGHQPTTSAIWRTFEPEPLGLDGYLVEGSPLTDVGLLGRALQVGAGDWLAARDGRLGMDFGCLWLGDSKFLADPAELDLLAATAAGLADRLRELSLATLPAHAFADPLPSPQPPGESQDPIEAGSAQGLDFPIAWDEVRDWVPGFAQRRGYVSEDPLAFHRAFPYLPLSGQAFGVFRGPPGRLAVTTEVIFPANLGEDVALLELPPGVADTRLGEPWFVEQRLTVSIRRGILCAKRQRAGDGGISGPALLELGEIAARFAAERGWSG